MKAPSKVDGHVSADEFRLVCSRFATGVCVITTTAPHGGGPHGITVNSFTSLSLEPPLVMAAIGTLSAQLPAFEKSGFFAVNILEEAQETLSRHFARHLEGRFKDIPWSPGATGSPIFADTLGVIECEIVQAFDTGDHRVLVGKALHARVHEGKPLLYYRSGYAGLR